MLAALDKHDELALHVSAMRQTGVTVDELREVFLQVAIYAGVPSPHAAFRVAKRVLNDPPASDSTGSSGA
jgi:alkylhydroperoxidase/carboxymuconolactone decarboxylase family protein YurZ